MFKRFLKSKKGKELIEIIVLFPFFIFLLLWTTLNVIKFVISTDVSDNTNEYTRIAITERNYYNALCSLAEKVNESETIITGITITSSDGKTTKTMSFSDNPDETTYFKNLITKDKDNKIGFNVNVSDKMNTLYKEMNILWIKGNYVSIQTERGIAPIINEVSKISIYNSETNKRETFDYGVSGVIKYEAKGVIIN